MSEIFNLSPLVALAEAAAVFGGKRRPQFAPPIPFVDPCNGRAVGARIWGVYSRPRNGYRLLRFCVRLGKTKIAPTLGELHVRADGTAMLSSDYDVSQYSFETEERFLARKAKIAPVFDELVRRLRALEGDLSGDHAAAFAAHALEAGFGICVMCGRSLSDPHSIHQQIGPECLSNLKKAVGR